MVRVTNVLRFCKTEARRLAFWLPKGTGDWRRRMALTYAVSAWSMMGFVAYMQWQSKGTVKSSKTDETLLDIEENPDPSQERKQKISFSASIEYKENPVPYTTRIYQYFTSSNKPSDSGSTEN